MGESTHKKTARRRPLCIATRDGWSGCESRSLIASTIGHEANASEANDHHRPGRGFGDCRDRTEETVALAVDAISEVQCVGVATIAPVPENEGPKAARSVRACVYWDGADPSAGDRIESVNLAVSETEIADEQITAKLTKTRWGKSDTPRRRKAASSYKLIDQVAIRIEYCDCAHAGCRGNLGRATRRRISHVDISIDSLNIEGNQSGGND
jgi:hypothetical protein